MYSPLMNNIAILSQEAHSSCPLPSALTGGCTDRAKGVCRVEESRREEQLAVHFSPYPKLPPVPALLQSH